MTTVVFTTYYCRIVNYFFGKYWELYEIIQNTYLSVALFRRLPVMLPQDSLSQLQGRFNIFQAAAMEEGRKADFLYAVRYDHAFQVDAAVEGPGFNTCHPLRHDDTGQADAVTEGRETDLLYAGR